MPTPSVRCIRSSSNNAKKNGAELSDENWPKTLTATGSSYYAEDEIITMSNVKIGDNIFWGKSVREVKNRLLKDPYIEKIKIERKLPDKINFKITERKTFKEIIITVIRIYFYCFIIF